MSTFFTELMRNLQAATSASQQRRAGSPVRKKDAECTPCAASAYVENLRSSINGPPPKRRKPRR